MTWVKICGITNLEDALVAVEAGADAVGFVFYEKSPRCIDAEKVGAITTHLPVNIERVGVFVSPPNESFCSALDGVGLSGLQFHAESFQPHAFRFKSFDTYIVYPASQFLSDAGEMEDVLLIHRTGAGTERIRGIFLDSGTPALPGGTGTAFDWKAVGAARVAAFIESCGWNLIVAGGLQPANVANAMRILRPWGVDVSSGVEARPGKKDPDKVRAFIKAVREADKVSSN